MSAPRWSVLLAVVASGLILASCGGGGDSGVRTAGAKASPEVIARANVNCRQMLRNVKRVAKRVLNHGYPSALALINEGFVKPGISLIKGVAKRQQTLEHAADDPRFDLYANLFDPIIVLAEQRLRAGQTEDRAQSLKLQDLLTSLGQEQRQAARLAGLHDCDVDFLNAMVRAAT